MMRRCVKVALVSMHVSMHWCEGYDGVKGREIDGGGGGGEGETERTTPSDEGRGKEGGALEVPPPLHARSMWVDLREGGGVSAPPAGEGEGQGEGSDDSLPHLTSRSPDNHDDAEDTYPHSSIQRRLAGEPLYWSQYPNAQWGGK